MNGVFIISACFQNTIVKNLPQQSGNQKNGILWIWVNEGETGVLEFVLVSCIDNDPVIPRHKLIFYFFAV